MSASTRAFAALLAAGIGLGSAASASAAEVRPFEPRFQQRVRGDISIVTSDSRLSTTTRPAGSTLLFAGLYWGGAARAPTALSVQVGSAPPTPVAADDLDAAPLLGFGAVADVTELFAGTGPSVDLFVDGPAAVDWSLVTAWSSPTEPLRDLRVVDGLATVTASDPAAVTVSGLSTPRQRAVDDPTVEVVSHGGDAHGEVEVQAGDTTVTVPVELVEADETLVAAVTTASRAAAVTDLGVSAGVSPTTATAGGTVTVTVDVSNAGPDDQTGPAALTVLTSDGLAPDPVSLRSTTGMCGLIDARVVCALDPLPAGGRAVVTFDAELGAEATGPIGATARVLAPTADTDPVPANDTTRTDLESPAP
jgi:uncharacterized repeat protein (TIGR01451 family)